VEGARYTIPKTGVAFGVHPATECLRLSDLIPEAVLMHHKWRKGNEREHGAAMGVGWQWTWGGKPAPGRSVPRAAGRGGLALALWYWRVTHRQMIVDAPHGARLLELGGVGVEVKVLEGGQPTVDEHLEEEAGRCQGGVRGGSGGGQGGQGGVMGGQGGSHGGSWRVHGGLMGGVRSTLRKRRHCAFSRDRSGRRLISSRERSASERRV
jgi:hypothetical protein